MNSLLSSPFRDLFGTKAPSQRIEARRQTKIRQREGMIQGTRLALQQWQIVAIIEENALLAPTHWMLGYHFIVVAQNHPIHAALDQDFMVGVGHRHRVIVIIKTHQGKRVAPCGLLAAGTWGNSRRNASRSSLNSSALQAVFPRSHRLRSSRHCTANRALSSSRSLTAGTGTKKFSRVNLTTPSTTPFSFGWRTRQKCSRNK